MYQHYLQHFARGGSSASRRTAKGCLFQDFQELSRVWTHPKALKLSLVRVRREVKRVAKKTSTGDVEEEAAVDFIDEDPASENDERIADVIGETNKEKAGTSTTTTELEEGRLQPENVETPESSPVKWWSQFVTDDDMTRIEHSGKLILLMDILRQCELIGDKVLVFSQSLVSLDLIQEFLKLEAQQRKENQNNWRAKVCI